MVMVAYGFQQPQCSCCSHVRRILRLVERDPDMRLRRQIVDFIGLHLLEDVAQSGAVGNIPGVEKHTRIGFVRIHIQMLDSIRVEC